MENSNGLLSSAARAAIRIGSRFGYQTDDALVVQESNNTVVWLRPYAVIAKVGRRSHSAASLVREHEVADFLSRNGAAVAPPVEGIAPTSDDDTGFMVTLWQRLDNDPESEPSPRALADSLRELHHTLMRFEGELPSFEASLDLARTALWDDVQMRALPVSDRSMLRLAYDRLLAEVRTRHMAVRPLHGEAHGRNVLVTPQGLRWIDFEGACIGPLEWDLAFLPQRAIDAFPEADARLLSELRTLNSARVATWCFARWEFPELRWHARFHLEQVRRAEETRTSS
jgi:aminoglycoside/choline kinase family phosphotransferase